MTTPIPTPAEVFGWRPEDRAILETLQAALPLVQFAVANLPPETIVWPYEQLRAFGERLKSCPGLDLFTRELGQNLIGFAAEFRKLRAQHESWSAEQKRKLAGIREPPQS